MYTTIETLNSRFEKNQALYRDLACLSPLQFEEVKLHIPSDAMEKLIETMIKFDQNASKEDLQSELRN